MKWEGHRRITRAVAGVTPLPEDGRTRLVADVIAPDTTRAKYEAHHTGRERTILGYVAAARRHYLRGESGSAATALAYALHFVQDGCFPGASSPDHDSMEEEATGELVSQCARDYRSSSQPLTYSGVVEAVDGLGPEHDVRKAVEAAVALSYDLAGAVFGPAQAPPGVLEQARERVLRHYTHWVPVAALASGGFGVLAALVFHWPVIIAAVGSLVLLAWIASSDRGYRIMRGELDWFEGDGATARRRHLDEKESSATMDEEEVPF